MDLDGIGHREQQSIKTRPKNAEQKKKQKARADKGNYQAVREDKI